MLMELYSTPLTFHVRLEKEMCMFVHAEWLGLATSAFLKPACASVWKHALML